jgi:hypothetical protein
MSVLNARVNDLFSDTYNWLDDHPAATVQQLLSHVTSGTAGTASSHTSGIVSDGNDNTVAASE